jgi:hypothetical protein
MGIFSKSPESAQNAVTKAEGVVAEWERKAADARAEAGRLDAESGAAILEDESAAERITLNIQTWERKARAYDQAAGEARSKLLAAQKGALEAEAHEEEKESAADRKKADAHEAKVLILVAELEKLDGSGWERASFIDPVTGQRGGQFIGLTGQLNSTSERHAIRAAAIRYFLATGKAPNDFYEINEVVGTTFPGFLRSIHEDDYVPASIYAARDAGLNFAGVLA